MLINNELKNENECIENMCHSMYVKPVKSVIKI